MPATAAAATGLGARTDSDRAAVVAVLRRMTFGPTQAQLDTAANQPASVVVDALLAAAPLDVSPPELGTGDDYGVVVRWWVRQLLRPDAGLHERMVWFWHTHLTSSLDKAEPGLMFRQHKLLRTHALGNFRELMQEITVDAAMLSWLDGASNTAAAANENYSRELMELFTLGRVSDAFTETDVRNGARALAGWSVDSDHANAVVFSADDALAGETVEYLGRRVGNAHEVIDAVCAHAACAPFVVAKLHAHLAGAPPTADRAAELAALFVQSGLEIRPVVEAIVHQPTFSDAAYVRPRSGLEWYLACCHLYDAELDTSVLDGLGQVPMQPPNVAGWPGSTRWVSASAVFEKASVAWDRAGDLPTLNSADPVAEVLAKAGLFAVSNETRATLQAAAKSVEGRREQSSVLHALVACCPEMSLA